MAKQEKKVAEKITKVAPDKGEQLSGYIPTLKLLYKNEIVPNMMKEFGYKNIMEVPKLLKITLNQGIGASVGDKKLADTAQAELTSIAGQKAIVTHSKKDISNFKLRKGMSIGVKVTLRGDRMYEFLERLIKISLPRIRDFQGISNKLDGRGNYSLGVKEQIIFPEIDIDKITKIMGLEMSFSTTASTDNEAFSLLKSFGLPFKSQS